MKILSWIMGTMIFFSGCASYKFAADGVKPMDVDQYVNVEEGIQVWLYLDYDNDIVRGEGLRLDRLYEDDRWILKLIDLPKRSSKVLFSVKSSRQPAHHLLAIKQPMPKLDTALYTYTHHNDSHFYQRDLVRDDTEIRHVIIPYEARYALHLVYFADKSDNVQQPFHKIDYLARINAYYLQHPEEQKPFWQVNECAKLPGDPYDLRVEPEVLKMYKLPAISLTAYDEVNPSLTYFKVLTPEDKLLSLRLCPATYLIKYLTKDGDVIQRDTLVIADDIEKY